MDTLRPRRSLAADPRPGDDAKSSASAKKTLAPRRSHLILIVAVLLALSLALRMQTTPPQQHQQPLPVADSTPIQKAQTVDHGALDDGDVDSSVQWLRCLQELACPQTRTTVFSRDVDIFDAGYIISCSRALLNSTVPPDKSVVRASLTYPPYASRRPTVPEMRVACVGDSITYGNGTHLHDKARDIEGSYPVELQQVLDREFELVSNSSLIDAPFYVTVTNYGKGGRTAADQPQKYSYRREAEFKQSLASSPHIVIIVLGTNDSKSRTWRGAAAFISDLDFLVKAYEALPTKPQIVLASPPPSLSTLGQIRAAIIRDEIVPAVKKFVADLASRRQPRYVKGDPASSSLPPPVFVDLHAGFQSLFGAVLARPTVDPSLWPKRAYLHGGDIHAPGVTYFHDGVHPTAKGHRAMAILLRDGVCSGFQRAQREASGRIKPKNRFSRAAGDRRRKAQELRDLIADVNGPDFDQGDLGVGGEVVE
jgi:lysophospholipase L1-like esterase